MSNYDFNMQALKRNYPNVAEAVEKLKDDGTCRVVTSRVPQKPTVMVKAKGADWLIHSKENPQQEAYAFIDTVLKQQVEYANIVVVLGVGFGYHLEPLFARYSHLNTLFIVIENNLQLFKKFIQNNKPMVSAQGQAMSLFDFPGLNLMVGIAPDQVYNYLFEFMMKTGRNSHASFLFIEHPVLIRFNKEYYKPVCSEIGRVCYDIRSSYGNDPEDSWIGIDHMLLNLNQIANKPGIIQIKDKFKDVPAVIVATGPSLNKNIDLLPEIKDKAVFFAADASLNTFTKHDPPIMPDIVCSLERNLSTANHFKQIEDKGIMEDIWLCACPVVMPDVYNAWEGKDVTLYRDFAHFTWLGVDKGKINTGKSVTNMAFQAAVYLGCNPIVLVGQDLAFAPDGQTHVKGADHARDGLAKSQLIQQRIKVLGNDGTQLDSLDTWLGMLKRFEYDIAKLGPETKVINATEGGAKINGAEVMPLREVIDKYCKTDWGVRLRLNKHLTYPDEETIVANKATMEKNIQDGIKYIEESLKELDETLEVLEEASEQLPGMNEMETNDLFNYCDKIRQKVLTDDMCYKTAMHVIQSWCMGRENVFMAIPGFYKNKEMWVERCIKMFEFFYGLRKLYRMMLEGVKVDYEKWKSDKGSRPEVVSSVSDTTEQGQLQPIKREEDGLDLHDMQQEAVEVDQTEGLDGGGI